MKAARPQFRKTPLVLALTAAMALPISTYAAPGDRVGEEFRVNTITTGTQSNGGVSSDANGNYIVVWQSPDDSDAGIYAQRYNNLDEPQGGEFQVNTTTFSIQRDPVVALDADGDAVITWASYGQDGSNYGIYAQRYTNSGLPNGGEFRVNTLTNDRQSNPAVALDADGDFTVAWHGTSGTSSGSYSYLSVYAQRYNNSGTPIGGEFRVNTTTNIGHGFPVIALDADGDTLITWASFSRDGRFGINAQRYNNVGTRVGSQFRVNTTTSGRQNTPAIGLDADGDALIAWQANGENGSFAINAQRYNNLGVPNGGEFRVNTTTADRQGKPAVALDADGDAVIAWQSFLQDGDSYGIYAQRYNNVGTPIGGEFQVNTTTVNAQLDTAVTLDADGDTVIVWSDFLFAGPGNDVFAQRYAGKPAGSLQFSSPTYNVSEAGGTATITVTRTGSSIGEVSASYTTSDGSATAPSDYVLTVGTVTFAAGDTEPKTFTVPISDDTAYETDETVNLTLSDPTGGATLGTQTSAVLTIADNESTLQFSAPTYSVGEAGGNAIITVTRTGSSNGAVSASYTTSDGTAVAPSDYALTTGTITFADGDVAPKTFIVAIANDPAQETDETVNLSLSTPTGGATLGTQSSAVLTIADNDSSLQFSIPTYSINESGGAAAITVTRTGSSNGEVSVSYSTNNGTAVAPSDYTSTSGSITFADGDTVPKTFSVPVVNDATAESRETITLSLNAPTGGATLGTQRNAVLSIRDNEATALQFRTSGFTVNEAGGTATITVTRTGRSDGTVAVNYATGNGTAIAGSDYTATSGTLTFLASQASKTFTVPITNDILVDPNETINLTLSNVTNGAVLGTPSSALLTIIDNDTSLQFSTANYSVNEGGGTATIRVIRIGNSSQAVAVNYATSNGSAIAGSDYTAKTGTVSFAAGDNAFKTFTVNIVNDTLVEPNETVRVTLSNPTNGATLGSVNPATLTIVNND